jgi:hypothetical protein
MELIDRYLQAVGFWLPKGQRDDIITELSEDIRSRIQDQEASLGRKLKEAEVETILKQLGRPVLVANRYLPQEQLIGPVLFPVYRFVLKMVFWGYLTPWILLWIGLMVFSPGYRAAHSGGTWPGALSSFWATFPLTAFIVVGVVTLVFAALERVSAGAKFLADWDPRKLPPVRDPNRIERTATIIDLTVSVAFLVWWVSELRFRTEFEFAGATITLAPQWRYFLCGFLLVSLATLITSWVNLLHPYWTRRRASIRLAYDCVGSTLFCWLLKSAILVAITAPNVAPDKTLAVTNAIQLCASRLFPIAVIGCLVMAFLNIRRILSVNTPASRQAQYATAG